MGQLHDSKFPLSGSTYYNWRRELKFLEVLLLLTLSFAGLPFYAVPAWVVLRMAIPQHIIGPGVAEIILATGALLGVVQWTVALVG